MTAIMVVDMTIVDGSWERPYQATVPALLAEYGAKVLAGAREVRCLEGTSPPPDRVAVLSFPSLEAIDRFMGDPRYLPLRRLREAGAPSRILVFENAAAAGELP